MDMAVLYYLLTVFFFWNYNPLSVFHTEDSTTNLETYPPWLSWIFTAVLNVLVPLTVFFVKFYQIHVWKQIVFFCLWQVNTMFLCLLNFNE